MNNIPSGDANPSSDSIPDNSGASTSSTSQSQGDKSCASGKEKGGKVFAVDQAYDDEFPSSNSSSQPHPNATSSQTELMIFQVYCGKIASVADRGMIKSLKTAAGLTDHDLSSISSDDSRQDQCHKVLIAWMNKGKSRTISDLKELLNQLIKLLKNEETKAKLIKELSDLIQND